MSRPTWDRPLQWPEGVKTSLPCRSQFKPRTFGAALDLLWKELHRFGTRNIHITANVQNRSSRGSSTANGVAVQFRLVRRRSSIDHVIACDGYTFASDNAIAIMKTIEALRAIERHGTAQLGAMALQGFRALPASTEEDRRPHRAWRVVLDVPPDIDHGHQKELARVHYRAMQVRLHPDKGGDPFHYEELQGAWARAQEELG